MAREATGGRKATGRGRVAVVGCGYWGKNLVRNYYELGELGLICDSRSETLANLGRQYPEAESCRALSDVLGREGIEAVAIATPAESHYQLAREALLAGKHVYVEKPLVLLQEQARDLIALAEERGLVLMVGHLLQYHPAFRKLKQLVAGGELGRVNYIYSHRLNLGKIRREENILWSFAPHDVSMILALAGERPEKVLATGGNYLHRRIADVTTTHLEFASGLRAHIFVSWLHPYKEQRLVVVGDTKMAVFDDTLPWPDKLLLFPHEIQWKGNLPVASKAEAQRVELAEREPLKEECLHFLQCLDSGSRPYTDGHEGLAVLEVLNAAQRALDHESFEELMAEPAGAEESGEAQASEPEPFVHPTAVVDEGVEIGAGTKIWHFSHVLKGSRVGPECNLGQNVVVGPEVTIGRGCKIQNNVSVYQGVTLEDGVFCGPSMVFTNVHNPRAGIRRMDELRPTMVRSGASLGANCTIVCGNTVGRHAFVGAGAVVTKDVPDHALVAGNPARRLGWMCACGVRLDQGLACPACGRAYRAAGPGLEPVEG
jgi:UDP-2-acetamido-3-amino-2,3-dideoxy-glucuronate N-acetyltransferase